MIERSTDITAALRSRQRGFLLNPFRFGGGGGDPYFSNVSLLLHMDGASGSTTFTDSGPLAKFVTPNGGVQISTAQSKFGGASAQFDGSDDALTCTGVTPSGAQDFTMEMWFYATTLPSSGVKMLAHWLSSGSGVNFEYTPSGALGLYSFSSAAYMSGGYAAPAQWHHCAIERVGNVFSIYLNGAVVASMTVATSFSTPLLFIGFDSTTTSRGWDGYLDDFRFTLGVARYKANFTPPTEAFPNS